MAPSLRPGLSVNGHSPGEAHEENATIECKVANYLQTQFGSGSALIGIERLGEGVHGAAYLVRFVKEGEEGHLVMKTLFPSGFGHEHFSDRAQVLLLANSNYNEMPKHIRALDVVAETQDDLLSLKGAEEFYIFMEEAKGESYFSDLDAILKRRHLVSGDRKRTEMMALFLAELHHNKYDGKEKKGLYRRRIRELMGHGECIMGMIDAYEQVGFTDDDELMDYATECMSWWKKLRGRCQRLSTVHGDFHPGNIWFQESDFVVLDRSRGTWGEPADDLSCLAINYVYYALKAQGAFAGPFAELFMVLMDTYLAETHDFEILEIMQPFLAFRALVIANPKFYPQDPLETKRKLLNFGRAVLKTDKFETDEVTKYLEASFYPSDELGRLNPVGCH